MKEVAVRKYGGNRMQPGRVNDVNFEDPGIQARRNIHTYSPYDWAGFRVNNKTHRTELQKDLFICKSTWVIANGLKQHHTAWVHRKSS